MLKKMNGRRILLLMLFVCTVNILTAQENRVIHNSFDYLRQANPWLLSVNAAGLQHLPIEQLSSAELFLNRGAGGFVDYYQSDNSLEWGAQTESFFRLHPKVVFYGKVDYRNFTGKNMGGSDWIDPAYHSFNLVELTDTDKGKKNREDYRLIGAAAVQLKKDWTAGAKVDYRSANYAKFKDLRHVNKLLDLTTTVGLTYSPGTIVEIGANYIYRRSIESVQFKLFGTTGKLYYTLLDFGAFYGRGELFGTSAFYTKDHTPMFNRFQGGALQATIRFSPKWQWFNEFSYQKRNGYYGKKVPSAPVFTEHDGTILSYEGIVSWNRGAQRHQWQADLQREKLINNENIFQYQHLPDGGQGDILYLDQNQMMNRNLTNIRLHYLFTLGENPYFPVWTLQAGAEAFERQQTVSVYPYYRNQTIRNACFYASGQKNKAIDDKNSYSIALRVLYGSGNHSHTDGVRQTPAAEQKPPATTDFNLQQEYDFLTAGHIQSAVGATYYRQLNPSVQGYLRAEYQLTNAFKTEYITNKTHQALAIAAGCTF